MRVLFQTLVLLVSVTAAAVSATPPNPMPSAGVETFRLPNDLRVVTRTDAAAPLVVVDLWVGAGAADDSGSGAAHAVEHMVFKGSGGVPAGAVDADVEAAGGILFAETLPDATHYWAAAPSENVGKVLDAMTRLMRPPDVAPDAWRLERGVMLEEIPRSRSNTTAELRRGLVSALFGPVYGAPVAGTPEALGALTPENIRAFFSRYYRPDRMTLVVVGPISASVVRQLASESLGRLSPGGGNPPALTGVPASNRVGVELTRHSGNTVDVGMAFSAPPSAAVDVLCAILAARLGARTAGLADRVDVSAPWRRAGFVVISAGGPAENEAAIRQAIRGIATTPPDSISAASVIAAVRRRKWSWWLGHEKATDQARALGLAATLGDVAEATDTPRRLDAVTVEQVRAAAKEIFAGNSQAG